MNGMTLIAGRLLVQVQSITRECRSGAFYSAIEPKKGTS